ncbi:MAG: CDP-alcohol phosphatidyltransferase family protein [Vicinamibacterales bacterium]
MSWPWRLPEQPLRAQAISVVVLGAIGAAFAAAAANHYLLRLGVLYPVKAAAIFSAVALAAAGGLVDSHPHPSFGAANVVTTTRVWLLALIGATLGEPSGATTTAYAAALTVIAVVLDGADGWLARRSGASSAFGARYDMEVDALLVLVLSLLVWQAGKAGVWIVLAGCMRYLFLGAASVWRWLAAPLPPSRRRQAMCVVQVVGLGAVLSPLLADGTAVGLAALTLAALLYSFLVDVVWLRRQHA